MKIVYCKYNHSGMEITLNIYFDTKAFDFITPRMTREQEEDFIRITSDSLAASLPGEKTEKYFYIKRIIKNQDNTLTLLITDGVLTDNSLIIPISQQAYAKERIKLTESEQLPARLNNDLLKPINNKLGAFEEEARKQGHARVIKKREAAQPVQLQMSGREFKSEKMLDISTEIIHIKKEIKNLAEHHLQILNSILTGKEKAILNDPLAREIKNNLQGVAEERSKEIIAKKINEIAPIENEFSAKIEEIQQQIHQKTSKLMQMKDEIIRSLYESAKDFHAIVLKKFEAAPVHARKSLITDFNRKFQYIASMDEAGELSSLNETQKNLAPLTLESLQEIISDNSKENPGLLQKCNTSFTEESPELKIVLNHLNKLKSALSQLFDNEMIQIIRIPSPRSFQFKFSEYALNYKKTVDAFYRKQREAILSLASHYKKILQLTDIRDTGKKIVEEPAEAPETINENAETPKDLQKYKEVSDTMVALANKDHQATEKFKTKAQEIYKYVKQNIDINLKSLIDKINSLIQVINTETKNADDTMQEITDTKSGIDITISHFLLHPSETADFNDLDQKIKLLGDKRNLLIAKNRALQQAIQRMSIYESIIKRIKEIDLTAMKNAVKTKRDEAKSFLLQLMKLQHLDPASAENYRKRMLDQYAKVDNSAADIDKIMSELSDIKEAIYVDLGNQRDIPTGKLESKFKDITEKIHELDSTVDNMNQNVTGLRELSQDLDKSRP